MQINLVKNYKIYESDEVLNYGISDSGTVEPKYEINIMKIVNLNCFPAVSTMLHFKNCDFIVGLQDIYLTNEEPEYYCIETDLAINEDGEKEVVKKIIELVQSGEWKLCKKNNKGYDLVTNVKKYFKEFLNK